MIRYLLQPRGVFDRETDRLVMPEDLAWLNYDAWLRAGNQPDLPPPPPLPTVAVVRLEKIAAVEQLAANLRRQVTDRASPSEMASWAVKLNQAEQFLASRDPALAPMLLNEAEARGVSLESIVERVLRNAALFKAAEAQIAGASGRHKDVLKNLQTREEIDTYDITVGWPRIILGTIAQNGQA